MNTRRPITLLLAVTIAAFSFQGCNKNESQLQGTIEFGVNPLIEETLKSLSIHPNNVDAALVTIVNSMGETVYEKEYLEFYSFGNSYVTRSLKLDVGEYKLKEFLLVDSSGTVTWATPLEGSRLAHMVDDPLPIEFVINENNTTQVNPEVVRVGIHNPGDFGYVNFNVTFVDNFCIRVFYESDCYWIADDSLMYDGVTIFNPDYGARILVYGANGQAVTESYIHHGENRVAVPRGYDKYKIVVYDCYQSPCFTAEYSREELKHFACAEGEFLHIECFNNDPEVIITPEDVLEPTIEQGVFGQITQAYDDSTYYEDSIYTEDYVLEPVSTKIYIYKDNITDSLYIQNGDCYIYPEIYFKPLAIVKSNSKGYYQLPLEEGVYSYMVETPMGFYVDAYVNSHMPGVLKVVTGEVTILDVHITPCYWY